jgi:hypothetical protein
MPSHNIGSVEVDGKVYSVLGNVNGVLAIVRQDDDATTVMDTDTAPARVLLQAEAIDFEQFEEAIRKRLARYHRSLDCDGNRGGYQVVHGTTVELGGDGRASFTADHADIAAHIDRLDAKFGEWEDGPYPAI